MKKLVLTVVLAALLNAAGTLAQPNKKEVTKKQTASLLMGIKSENTGLKKSAIYMAGKYQIEDATKTLIDQLKVEGDASTRVLIALTLYKIGNQEGLEAVENLAQKDTNKEVRRMSNAILSQVEMDKTFDTASLK